MKTNARMIFAVSATLLLTACAATETKPAATGFQLDNSYMQAIERHARTKGIHVVWINAPSRSLAKNDEPGGD